MQTQTSLRVLVVDNTREPPSFGSKNIVHWVKKTAPIGTEVWTRRAPDSDLPSRHLNFDAVVISGSITSCMKTDEPWVSQIDEFIMYLLQKNIPLLGICYGHQALARCCFALAGKAPALKRSEHPELGWQEITWTAPSRLFEGLPERFVSYESHYEEVGETPPGTRVTATSERCSVQAFELQAKDAFGVQFHPEYSIEEAELSLANKLKKGERRDWILNPGKGSKLYDEQVALKIFGNFFRIAHQRKS